MVFVDLVRVYNVKNVKLEKQRSKWKEMVGSSQRDKG